MINFKPLFLKKVIESLNISSNCFFVWEVLENDKILIRVKTMSEEEMEDLKFAQNSDEILDCAQKRGFKPLEFEEFMEKLDS